jgi:hypothetical protein
MSNNVRVFFTVLFMLFSFACGSRGPEQSHPENVAQLSPLITAFPMPSLTVVPAGIPADCFTDCPSLLP